LTPVDDEHIVPNAGLPGCSPVSGEHPISICDGRREIQIEE
jgi:hypothetical protein